ncbi:MAG TPA: type II secretion system F family protein [Thermomicrobiales bacterium]|nr:type II secretion system F family protein [Thermomicrobiales bacterium]
MPPLAAVWRPEFVSPALAFLVVLAATLAAEALPGRRSGIVRRRLAPAAQTSAAPRVRRPRRIWPNLARRLPNRRRREDARVRAQRLLATAGTPMTVDRYFTIRSLLLFVATPLLALALFGAFGVSPLTLAGIALAILAVPRLLDIWLKRRARLRAQAMERHLPDALDLLVVCVEGGLSLPAALLQVANRAHNVAGQEFRLVLDDLNAGFSFRDAFLGLTRRSQAESVGIFCSTVIQADKVGMSIASTLRGLAETMRTRRRQAAEERARKAPIKMMPVIVLFMIPSLFVIILTPAAIQIIDLFSK